MYNEFYVQEECTTCPYIRDEYECRKAYIEDKNMNMDINKADIAHSCYCDKIGGKTGWWGYCSPDKTETKKERTRILDEKEKHRKRRKNTAKQKEKLQNLYQHKKSVCSCPVYPVDKYESFTKYEGDIVYYKKHYTSAHSKKYCYFKRQANKKVRRLFKTVTDLECYAWHEPWMDEDPEYMALYCDGFGWEWDMEEVVTEDPKFSIGRQKGNYRKVYEYKRTVD